jgi:uncharacterized protein YfdQ (DUF2303 family)
MPTDYRPDRDPVAAVPIENLAQTLARELPSPTIVLVNAEPDEADAGGLYHVGVPKGWDLKTIDAEKMREHPRRTAATVTLATADAFADYVRDHAGPESAVWCDFDPTADRLAFQFIADDHAKSAPGWRLHRANFTPRLALEWLTWKGASGEVKSQHAFAEFLEENEGDIVAAEGYPTSLQMLAMATEFEASAEKRLKSVIRLQSGGVRLEYVDDEAAATTQTMQLFQRFKIGIPVYWQGPAYRIDARLKYRQTAGKVAFWFDLVHPERVIAECAAELIERVRGAIGVTPLRMGVST